MDAPKWAYAVYLTGGRFESSDGKGVVESIRYQDDKIQETLGLSSEESIWPPLRGFNRFY